MSSILIYGPSGQGKTSGICPPVGESLDPKTTFIIAPDKKDLPFKGWKSKYKSEYNEKGKLDIMKSNYFSHDSERSATSALTTLNLMKKLETDRKDIKVGIIDTFTHIITDEFMAKASEKGYDKFTHLGKAIYDILDFARESRIKWICLAHNEYEMDQTGTKVNKVKTVGKLMDQLIDIPSMFTVVLIPDIVREKGKEPDYGFITQSDGTNAAKSPHGMFPIRIPNNYKNVVDLIEEYEN
jgi:hypothetical protein